LCPPPFFRPLTSPPNVANLALKPNTRLEKKHPLFFSNFFFFNCVSHAWDFQTSLKEVSVPQRTLGFPTANCPGEKRFGPAIVPVAPFPRLGGGQKIQCTPRPRPQTSNHWMGCPDKYRLNPWPASPKIRRWEKENFSQKPDKRSGKRKSPGDNGSLLGGPHPNHRDRKNKIRRFHKKHPP